MRLFGQAVIGCPEVAKNQAPKIFVGQFSPDRFADFYAAIANKK
jgi:hypothetical protein